MSAPGRSPSLTPEPAEGEGNPANPLHIRPVAAADLPGLGALLQREAALSGEEAEEVWVAVDAGQQVRATLRLRPRIGLALPRVSFHVGCVVHAARELGLFHRQRTLLLGHDHTGASELADIAWRLPAPESGPPEAVLRALVRTALEAIRRGRDRHGERLIVELPGPRDSAGQSPFWHGLGRHFYRGDPAAAAALHGPAWRTHVASLLPRHPIYASFLPDAAQRAIAGVAADAQPLASVLRQAGLRPGEHVNIEDAGPIFEAGIDDLLASLPAGGD